MNELIIGKLYTGDEVNEIQEQNADFDITEHCVFKLIKINKEELYEKNLITIEDWEERRDNYDKWHTNQIKWMIEILKRNKTSLPPLVVDINGFLQDGCHRLSAYHKIEEIKEILIFQEV